MLQYQVPTQNFTVKSRDEWNESLKSEALIYKNCHLGYTIDQAVSNYQK